MLTCPRQAKKWPKVGFEPICRALSFKVTSLCVQPVVHTPYARGLPGLHDR